VPESVAALIASFGAATRLGALEVVSNAVSDLTGRPATTVQTAFTRALTGEPETVSP